MKKVFTYLLLCLVSFAGVNAQIIEEKEKELFKKYKVSERIKYDYKYTNGVQAENGVKSNVCKYNSNGLVLEIISYNPKGEISTKEKFGYDDNGNRVMYERTSLRGDYKKDSEYDNDDKIVLESGYDGSAAFKTVYKYNSSNRVIEIQYFTDNLFMVDEKRVYKYNGNKATVSIMDKGNALKSTVNLIFNSKQQIIEETVVSLDGVELEKRLVEYNSAGKIAKEEKFRAGKRAYTLTYVYNAKGELTKLVEDKPSKDAFDKKLYKYDSEGRIVEYKWARKPGQEYNVKTYTYGSNGVCTKEHTLYPATNYQIMAKYEYSFR